MSEVSIRVLLDTRPLEQKAATIPGTLSAAASAAAERVAVTSSRTAMMDRSPGVVMARNGSPLHMVGAIDRWAASGGVAARARMDSNLAGLSGNWRTSPFATPRNADGSAWVPESAIRRASANVPADFDKIERAGTRAGLNVGRAMGVMARSIGVAGGALGGLSLVTMGMVRSAREFDETFGEINTSARRADVNFAKLSRTLGADVAMGIGMANEKLSEWAQTAESIRQGAVSTLTSVFSDFRTEVDAATGAVLNYDNALQQAMESIANMARVRELGSAGLSHSRQMLELSGQRFEAERVAAQETLRREMEDAAKRSTSFTQRYSYGGAQNIPVQDPEMLRTLQGQAQERFAARMAKIDRDEAAEKARLEAERRRAVRETEERNRAELIETLSVEAQLLEAQGKSTEAIRKRAEIESIQRRWRAEDVGGARGSLLGAMDETIFSVQSKLDPEREAMELARERIAMDQESLRITLMRLEGRQDEADAAQVAMDFARRESEIRASGLAPDEQARALADLGVMRTRMVRAMADASTLGMMSDRPTPTLQGGLRGPGGDSLLRSIFGASANEDPARREAAKQTSLLGEAVSVLKTISSRVGSQTARFA